MLIEWCLKCVVYEGASVFFGFRRIFTHWGELDQNKLYSLQSLAKKQHGLSLKRQCSNLEI